MKSRTWQTRALGLALGATISMACLVGVDADEATISNKSLTILRHTAVQPVRDSLLEAFDRRVRQEGIFPEHFSPSPPCPSAVPPPIVWVTYQAKETIGHLTQGVQQAPHRYHKIIVDCFDQCGNPMRGVSEYVPHHGKAGEQLSTGEVRDVHIRLPQGATSYKLRLD